MDRLGGITRKIKRRSPETLSRRPYRRNLNLSEAIPFDFAKKTLVTSWLALDMRKLAAHLLDQKASLSRSGMSDDDHACMIAWCFPCPAYLSCAESREGIKRPSPIQSSRMAEQAQNF
jgi:hypothetical protein